MQIKLVWENPNVIATTTKVYRGTQPLDRANLSNPLATLTQGETTWTDTTAIAGQRYYYVLESLTARDRAVSHNIEAWALPRTGPGSQKLIAGDLENGYYGDVPANDFFTATALREALNYTQGTIVQDFPIWMKFAREGKTLFIPAIHLVNGVTWQVLYNNGLVYGTDDAGSSLYTGSPVNQKRIVTLGKESFLVRLMTTGPKRADRGILPFAWSPDQDQTTGSEWDDLIYPTCEWVPVKQRRRNWAQKNRAAFNSFTSTVCQELVVGTPNQCMQRGSPSYPDKNALIYAAAVGLTDSTSWRPVLEHIPSYQINLNI